MVHSESDNKEKSIINNISWITFVKLEIFWFGETIKPARNNYT